MPRLLSDMPNTLVITDNLSGTELELKYRMPTTEEAVAYRNAVAPTRQGGQLVDESYQARVDYGLQILVSIRDGDFVVQREGQMVPLDNDDPQRDELLKKYAHDVLSELSGRVFMASLGYSGPALASKDAEGN